MKRPIRPRTEAQKQWDARGRRHHPDKIAKAASMLEYPREGMATIIEACRFLNVSQRYICTVIKDKSLPSVKLGRSRRIRWDALHAFARGVDVRVPVSTDIADTLIDTIEQLATELLASVKRLR